MKVIVVTSDGYRHLMPEFAERFNRFWGSDQDVDVLCYKVPLVLPVNFNVVSLGKRPANQDWTTGLIPYFEKQVSDHFVLMMDDYMLTEAVNVNAIEQILCMSHYFVFDKFDLTQDRARFEHEYTTLPFIVQSWSGSRYRTSLQPAIWRTDYFRKFLVPGRTPWDFELLGEKEAMNDGGVILGTTCGIVKFENWVLRGVENES